MHIFFHTIHTMRPRCYDLGTVTRVEAPLLHLRKGSLDNSLYTLATLYRKMHRFYLHTIVETTISTIQRLLRECKRVEKYLNYASRHHEPKKNFILYKP